MPFDWAAEGGQARCTKARIQAAVASQRGLYLRSRTSWQSACFARRQSNGVLRLSLFLRFSC